jgi:hypothetical protein
MRVVEARARIWMGLAGSHGGPSVNQRNATESSAIANIDNSLQDIA